MKKLLALPILFSLSPLAAVFSFPYSVNAHTHESLISLGPHPCAPFKNLGYCYKVINDGLFLAPVTSTANRVIVLQSAGGKSVKAYGKCKGCIGKWYRTGSAIVGRFYMGQLVEAWQCKGRSELGLISGYGHCHRVD